jgi:hypothetical protein
MKVPLRELYRGLLIQFQSPSSGPLPLYLCRIPGLLYTRMEFLLYKPREHLGADLVQLWTHRGSFLSTPHSLGGGGGGIGGGVKPFPIQSKNEKIKIF